MDTVFHSVQGVVQTVDPTLVRFALVDVQHSDQEALEIAIVSQPKSRVIAIAESCADAGHAVQQYASNVDAILTNLRVDSESATRLLEMRHRGDAPSLAVGLNASTIRVAHADVVAEGLSAVFCKDRPLKQLMEHVRDLITGKPPQVPGELLADHLSNILAKLGVHPRFRAVLTPSPV